MYKGAWRNRIRHGKVNTDYVGCLTTVALAMTHSGLSGCFTNESINLRYIRLLIEIGSNLKKWERKFYCEIARTDHIRDGFQGENKKLKETLTNSKLQAASLVANS